MRKRSNDKTEREEEENEREDDRLPTQGSTYRSVSNAFGGLPAFRGRGTPPTKTVLRGSSGREASRTKSASDNFHGLICTGLSWIKNGEMSS